MLAIAIFVVAYPLFQHSTAPSQQADVFSDQDLAELLARRDATYATLKELELDHEMGKLSSADYRALRDRYRAQAVAILQGLDSCQAKAQVQVARDRALEQKIEREIEQEIEREIAARRRRRRGLDRCPGCGVAFEPEDRFCRRCGVALEKEPV